MIQSLAQFILSRCLGWKVEITIPAREKCIICVAPHTSNWDFLLGEVFSQAVGRKAGFLMKKEWFFWPLGVIFKRLGGIPVWRSKHTSMTDNLAETAAKKTSFKLCITPEGTRSPNADWKKGFYFIALKASIPILLYGVDYEKKKITCTESFIPSGNIDEDMPKIKAYFKEFKGKKPENFAY